MKLYFIQHIPSGNYLPEPAGRQGRGGSHVEPSDPNNARIFRSYRSAKIALNAWLKGKWVTSRGYYSAGPDWDGEYYEDTKIVKVDTRIPSEMQIVEKEILL